MTPDAGGNVVVPCAPYDKQIDGAHYAQGQST
jgi:hypothetical protein